MPTRARIRNASRPTGSTEKNPAAVALGLLGGSKGGKARAAGMSKRELSKAASKAAKARWAKARTGEVEIDDENSKRRK